MEKEFCKSLTDLQRILKTSPEIFGPRLSIIQEEVKDAEAEIEQTGNLSEESIKKLDEIYRPYTEARFPEWVRKSSE